MICSRILYNMICNRILYDRWYVAKYNVDICETQVITGLRDQQQRQARSTEVSLENHVYFLVCLMPPISLKFMFATIFCIPGHFKFFGHWTRVLSWFISNFQSSGRAGMITWPWRGNPVNCEPSSARRHILGDFKKDVAAIKREIQAQSCSNFEKIPRRSTSSAKP